MPSSNNKHIAKNTLMLYFRMILTMLVSLYTSRIVLNTLGVEDYGIYNIVGGVVILFSFFNNAMSNATQRFLSFELGQNNSVQLKRTFSMSINVHIGIAFLIFLLAETVGLWFLNTHINIPTERMKAANWVYQFSIFTFLINIIRVPYHATIVAYEKMSFYAYLSIIEVLLKLGVVFLIQISPLDKLIFYGFLIFVVSVLILLVYKIYCNKNFDAANYNFFWDTKLFKTLISFSGWSLFGSAANVSSKQGTDILLNIFYGVMVNAAMGIANQVNNAVNGFVQNFQTAFKPQIVKSYAANETDYLIRLIFQTSKFSFFLLYCIALPILLNTEIVLQLWLKRVPAYAVGFVRLILIYSLLDSISGPLWMTVQATGRIKKYQIAISFIILSNLLISYLFLKQGYNPYIVLWIRIFLNITSLIYRITYLKKTISFPATKFVQKVILNIVAVVSISIVLPTIINCFTTGFNGFICSTLISVFSVGIVIYWVGLNSNEKNYIKSISKNFKNRLK
jgi:O-antigen/teichoic acid export membrane protein